jgi:DNA-directed RNA polymerase subunit RPC12/RpoP
MGRTIVSVTNTYSLYGVYKCSKCGKIVRFSKPVSSYGESVRAGITSRDSKLEPYRANAQRQADSLLPGYLSGMISWVEKGDYKRASLKCACNCGNVELWASFRPSLLSLTLNHSSLFSTIMGIGGFALIGAIIAICAKNWLVAGLLIAFPLCLAIYLGINNIINNAIQNRCSMISDDYKPHLFLYEEERESYILRNYNNINTNTGSFNIFQKRNLENTITFDESSKDDGTKSDSRANNVAVKHTTEAYASDTIPPVISVEQKPHPKFCRKCGAELLDDSIFCSQCGEKVIRN